MAERANSNLGGTVAPETESHSANLHKAWAAGTQHAYTRAAMDAHLCKPMHPALISADIVNFGPFAYFKRAERKNGFYLHVRVSLL